MCDTMVALGNSTKSGNVIFAKTVIDSRMNPCS